MKHYSRAEIEALKEELNKKVWAQDIQAQLSQYEETDEGYAEWCANHCRICGKELEPDDWLQEMRDMILFGKEPKQRPYYPVEYPGGGYRQRLCSDECDREWNTQFLIE